MGRKLFFIFAIAAIAVLMVINIYLGMNKQTSSESSRATPKPTPQGLLETQKVITPVVASEPLLKDSPDGKLTLMAKIVKGSDGVTYSFSVLGKEIFVKTVDPSITISVPYNTWSPNGKYIFLKEGGTMGVKFFALSTSVSSSDQNDQTANITDSFAEKYPNLKIGDVTGWGGINLLIVNSVKNDGSSGPSFWFEMPDHSFIQLSTRF